MTVHEKELRKKLRKHIEKKQVQATDKFNNNINVIGTTDIMRLILEDKKVRELRQDILIEQEYTKCVMTRL